MDLKEKDMNRQVFNFSSAIMANEQKLKDDLERADKEYRTKINSNTTKLNETVSKKNAQVAQIDQEFEECRRQMQT